jgi:hypothetical protein
VGARPLKEAEAVAAVQGNRLPHKPNHRAGDEADQRRVTAALQVQLPKENQVRRARLDD